MKNLFKIVMIAGLLTFNSVARAIPIPQAHSFSGSPAPSIETGAMLYVELSKALDAKKVKAGDAVTAHLMTDVLSHGKIVVPRDSKVIGHITEAQPYSKEKPESRLGIVFEKIRFKGGEELPLSSVLMALHPARQPTLDLLGGSTLPNLSLGGTLDYGRHYPMPVGSPKRPSSSNTRLGANQEREMEAAARAKAAYGPMNMNGLSLISSGSRGPQAVVSRNRTVKLESGVVMELRVSGSPGQ